MLAPRGTLGLMTSAQFAILFFAEFFTRATDQAENEELLAF